MNYRTTYRLFFIITALILTTFSVTLAVTLDEGVQNRLKIFFSQSDVVGASAVIKGRVVSFSSKTEIDEKDMLGRAQAKSRVTVRLSDPEGLHRGSILYIIDSKNLVTAKINVTTLFQSSSFGPMLIGNGNFRLATDNSRVVQKLADNYSRNAYIHKSRGDYYLASGDKGKAIAEYRKALACDSDHPESHLQLGLIYFSQGMYEFAFRELSGSYRHIDRIYDNADRFSLLRHMAEIRYRQVYDLHLPHKMRISYRKDGIRYSREAVKVYPDSARVHYLLGMFLYRSAGDKPEKNADRMARDSFLKVIEIDPAHAESYSLLSELYLKHENREKAGMYAELAVKHDPDNIRARNVLRRLGR